MQSAQVRWGRLIAPKMEWHSPEENELWPSIAVIKHLFSQSDDQHLYYNTVESKPWLKKSQGPYVAAGCSVLFHSTWYNSKALTKTKLGLNPIFCHTNYFFCVSDSIPTTRVTIPYWEKCNRNYTRATPFKLKIWNSSSDWQRTFHHRMHPWSVLSLNGLILPLL